MDNLELLADEFGYLKTNSPLAIPRRVSPGQSPLLDTNKAQALPQVASSSYREPISINLGTGTAAPDKGAMVMTPGRQAAGAADPPCGARATCAQRSRPARAARARHAHAARTPHTNG